jgi:hypothetical protein
MQVGAQQETAALVGPVCCVVRSPVAGPQTDCLNHPPGSAAAMASA